MFLERLEDAGITVHGLPHRIGSSVQSVATTVVTLLPRMGATMIVMADANGTLTLRWQNRKAQFDLIIAPNCTVHFQVKNVTEDLEYHCDGTSSELQETLELAVSIFLSKSPLVNSA